MNKTTPNTQNKWKYYLEEIERYIDKLKSESFEGWTEDEIKGYLTACESIKQKVNPGLFGTLKFECTKTEI